MHISPSSGSSACAHRRSVRPRPAASRRPFAAPRRYSPAGTGAGDLPPLSRSAASASASLMRSSVWMQSNSATASLTLLVCSGPIRCNSRSGNSAFSAGNLPCASCTRFSPNRRWPAASASRMPVSATVLVTATSLVLRGGLDRGLSRRLDARQNAREILWNRHDFEPSNPH